MKLTCASCGEKKELCDSVISCGIKQPRICKECLIVFMETGDETIQDKYWIRQLVEAGDEESFKNLLDKSHS